MMKPEIFQQCQQKKVDVILGQVTKKITTAPLPSNSKLSFAYLALNDHPEFVEEGAKLIANKIQALEIKNPYFVTAEASTISLAHVLRYKHQINGAILYKKPRVDDIHPIAVPYFSITSTIENKLYLDVHKTQSFRNETIIIIDSIVTTGGTIKAMYNLLIKVGINPQKIHSAMVLFTEDIVRKQIEMEDKNTLPVHSFGHLPLFHRLP